MDMDGKNKGTPLAAALIDRLSGEGRTYLRDKGAAALRLGALGFLLAGGEVAFGARPFGIALLSCLPGGVIGASVGVIARCLMGGGGASMAIGCAILALIRLLSPIGRAEEEDKPSAMPPDALRVCLGCATALFCGIWRLMEGGFAYGDLYALLLSLALMPILVMGLRVAFLPEKRHTLAAEGGQALLTCAILIALRPMRVLGFSLAVAVGFLLTLLISSGGGWLRGGVAGCLFGLVLQPTLSPVMGLGGLAAGLLREKGAAPAAVGGAIAAILCDWYVEGSALLLSPLPDLLLGAMALPPLLKWEWVGKLYHYSASFTAPAVLVGKGRAALNAEEEGKERLAALEQAMESLSDTFYRLSDRMRRPEAAKVRAMCEECFREHCVKCPMTALCWVRQRTSTADVLSTMTRVICREGILSVQDLPPYFAERCKALDRVVAAINNAHVDALEQAARSDKLSVLALDYRAMAALLGHASRIHAAETEIDPVLSAACRRLSEEMGLGGSCVTVVGKRRRQISIGGVTPGRIRASAEELREAFGQVMEMRLTPPRFDLEGDYVTMTMSPAHRIELERAEASCGKEGETVSGDSVAFFENREDYAYALISDGMGSGSEAALTSRMCITVLEALLAAGNPKGVAIEMLNNFIRNKNLECFATVDLLQVDLLSGKACFVKSGAAPSFVLREGKLFKISSATLPVGITRQVKSEEVRFDLEVGDVIVLLSDGVAEGGGEDLNDSLSDSLWLADMLTFEWKEGEDLAAMSEKILSRARSLHRRSDDMTVVMVRVVEPRL